MGSKSLIHQILLRGSRAGVLALLLAAVASPAFARAPKSASADFERFRWSFFEDNDSPRNGLDTVALRRLAGKERRTAERMLIRYLPDARGVIGLGALRSARAEPQLRRLFMAERRAQRAAHGTPASTGRVYMLLYLAKALWPIRPHAHYLAAVTDVLAASNRHLSRMEAAIALSVFRHTAAVRALIKALDDPERLVRHHAANSILAIHGLRDLDDTSNVNMEHMIYRIMSEDADKRDGGKRDVLAAIAGRPITR